MKRMVFAVLTGAAALAVLVVIQGCGVLGGPPTGVAVSAGPDESDSTVVVSWTPPAEGGPDKYIVYFRAVTDSGFEVIGEATGTSYAHNPHDTTGQYKVAAVFEGESYEGADKPTTVPIHSDATTLFEINADSSKCGYGWTRDSGIGGVFKMTDSANCGSVDFYISDLMAGFGQVSIKVVRPDTTAIDPGAGIVPAADWRASAFSDPRDDPQAPLPRLDALPPARYWTFCGISRVPCYIAYVAAGQQERHYALIQVNNVDVASGQVELETFYQLVPGLRLIRH